MFDYLNKPYPFNDDFKRNLRIIPGISLAVFLFLILYKPLDLSVLDLYDKVYLLLGFALVTLFSLGINLLVLPAVFPGIFLSGKWKVKHEIFWNLWILMTITVGYFFYARLTGLYELNFDTLIRILLFGIIPVSLLIVINQDRQLKMNLHSVDGSPDGPTTVLVNFPSKYKRGNAQVNLHDLVMIHSAQNYIEIYYKEDGQLRKMMVRNTLENAMRQVKRFPHIIRCHRTCIVNVKYVTRMRSSQHGYHIQLDGVPDELHVSRSFAPRFREIYDKLHEPKLF
ncbi:LytTR family DNA-binding domain-containing protein [Prolixibacter sp. SD074]|jgi:hypothetical protein|uniref:LytTR family DNA-binding domain-containing protein n=1 Tax=Prolixibacter sp. SD074 TaxID=2652391 RepID=UPI00126F73D6|nr:LytTR family DNA-binding domain-containing protein [Prolixibacter sp. SD074]GET28559.1 hypothetical protein SD074_07610 [Prolixibacter sp. SD074]